MSSGLLVRVLIVLLALEAAGLAVLGIAYAVSGIVGAPTDRVATELEALLIVLLGVGLALTARALAHGRPGGRAPALVANLLALPVAFAFLQAGRPEFGIPLLLLALGVAGLLVSPAVGAHMTRRT